MRNCRRVWRGDLPNAGMTQPTSPGSGSPMRATLISGAPPSSGLPFLSPRIRISPSRARAVAATGPAIVWVRIGNTSNDILLARLLTSLGAIEEAIARGETVVEVVPF